MEFGQHPQVSIILRSMFLLIVCTCLCLSNVCAGTQDNQYPCREPQNIGDGWDTGSLDDTGIDTGIISTVLNRIHNGLYTKIDSVLLIKNDKLVLEEYFNGYHRRKLHQIRSATKSIGSVLLGIAIDREFIPDEHQPVYPFFKKYNSYYSADSEIKHITLKSLLTMTSGYACDDHDVPAFQCEKAMYKTSDWLEYALELPVSHKPGEHWAYNSASLQILGEIITQTTEMTVPEFANRYLFNPLSINDFRWGATPKGKVFIAGNARMLPRDMAKIGYLMLNHGRWNNRQLLSRDWIERSTRNQVKPITHVGYGYLWWTGEAAFGDKIIEAYWAVGNGGNYIFVCPELSFVAVFTGRNFNSILEVQPLAILTNYFIPAMLPPIPPRKEISPDPSLLEACVGEYRMRHLRFTVSKSKSGLRLKMDGKSIRLHAGRMNVFFAEDDILGNMTISFKKGLNGEVESAVINSIFQVMPFRKVS